MMFRPVLLLALLALLTPSLRASDEARPGFFQRVLQTLHLAKRGEKSASVRAKNLTLDMTLAPDPVKLSETRQIKATLTLANHTSKFVHLEFPTTQRIELLVKNDTGKVVTQWSEDQSFSNEVAYVTVNPGEHIEYHASFSTRDLRAGEQYTVEGFFPNFSELRIQKTLVPQ